MLLILPNAPHVACVSASTFVRFLGRARRRTAAARTAPDRHLHYQRCVSACGAPARGGMPAAFLPKLDSSTFSVLPLDDVWSATDTSQGLVVRLQSHKPKTFADASLAMGHDVGFLDRTPPRKVHPQHVAGDRGSQPPDKQLRGQGLRIRGRDRAAPALLVRELYAQGPPVELRPGHGQRFDSGVARTKLDERIGRGALSTDKADVGDGAKWAKIARSMSPCMAGLRLATWIVDIFLVMFGSTVYCCAAALLRGSWEAPAVKAGGSGTRDAYCRRRQEKDDGLLLATF